MTYFPTYLTVGYGAITRPYLLQTLWCVFISYIVQRIRTVHTLKARVRTAFGAYGTYGMCQVAPDLEPKEWNVLG